MKKIFALAGLAVIAVLACALVSQASAESSVSCTGCLPPCSSYSSQSSCESDLRCDWCFQCNNLKYSGGPDRCVPAGTCVYYCEFSPVTYCNAQCEADANCQPYCNGSIRYYNPSCHSCSCTCRYGSTENCDSYDGWYNSSSTRWVSTGQCTEKEQYKREYRNYYCSPSACAYDVSDFMWLDTGRTRNKPDGTSCDDGLFCTVNDVCGSGTCVGSPRNCSDGISCTADSCDEENDICRHNANNSYCNDGLYCNGEEICDIVLGCVNGTPIDCSSYNLPPIGTCLNNPDGNPFTWDYADAFISHCIEAEKTCSRGCQELNHTCADNDLYDSVPVGGCNAECDENEDCVCPEDRCVGRDYYDYPSHGVCSASCVCTGECTPLITTNDPRCAYCGDGYINPGEECEPPGTVNNSYCIQSTSQCSGHRLGTRDLYGNCNSACGCVYDNFVYSCVKGQCGAACSNDGDCPADGWVNTTGWIYKNYNCMKCIQEEYRDYSCSNEECSCSYQVTATRERCEPVNNGMVCGTGLSYECIDECSRGQQQFQCIEGECAFTGFINVEECNPYRCDTECRNAFCSTECEKDCGAECENSEDCGDNSCEETYYDYCVGKRLFEYDSDKVMDSTVIKDNCHNYCNELCNCVECSVNCSPPSVNNYCVKGICNAECARDIDCNSQHMCNGTIYYYAQGRCNSETCSCLDMQWFRGNCTQSLAECGAECDSNDDCRTKLMSDICYYGGSCNDRCDCGYQTEYCPEPGTVIDGLCYYGERICNENGCSINSSEMGCNDYCDPLEGPKDLQKPRTTITFPPNGTAHSTDFDVSIEDYDNCCLESCYYRVFRNGIWSTWMQRECNSQLHIDIGEVDCPAYVCQETLKVEAYAVDCSSNVGNTGSKTYRIDRFWYPAIVAGPSGILNTSNVVLYAETDKPSVCRFDYESRWFDNMTYLMNSVNNITHTYQLNNLADGPHAFHVRCRDMAGNTMRDDHVIFFYVNTAGNHAITIGSSSNPGGYFNPGWNMFYLPRIILEDAGVTNFSVENVLSSIAGEYEIIFYFNGTEWVSYAPGRPVNTLTQFIDNSNMPYWIKIKQGYFYSRIEIG